MYFIMRMLDFGQFRLRPAFFFDFGQFDFGQFRLRPIFGCWIFGPPRVGPQRVEARKGGAPKGGSPEGWGPEGAQNFALFPPPPATIFLLLSLSWGPFVEFWWCLKRRGPAGRSRIGRSRASSLWKSASLRMTKIKKSSVHNRQIWTTIDIWRRTLRAGLLSLKSYDVYKKNKYPSERTRIKNPADSQVQ